MTLDIFDLEFDIYDLSIFQFQWYVPIVEGELSVFDATRLRKLQDKLTITASECHTRFFTDEGYASFDPSTYSRINALLYKYSLRLYNLFI